MKSAIIVVDFQVDFVTGALGFKKAEKLEQLITERLENAVKSGEEIIFTLDTHKKDYLETQEGKLLPIEHCIKNTPGWPVYGKVGEYLTSSVKIIEKPGFGSIELMNFLIGKNYDRIELCGLVTNICIVANAVIAKTALPEAKITIKRELTSSFDNSLHEAAMKILESLQINIID